MLGKSARAVVGLVLASSCAHNVGQDTSSGGDAKIKGAKPEDAYKSLSKTLNSLADAEAAAWKQLKVTPCSQQ